MEFVADNNKEDTTNPAHTYTASGKYLEPSNWIGKVFVDGNMQGVGAISSNFLT
jgi:hypothetical protein